MTKVLDLDYGNVLQTEAIDRIWGVSCLAASSVSTIPPVNSACVLSGTHEKSEEPNPECSTLPYNLYLLRMVVYLPCFGSALALPQALYCNFRLLADFPLFIFSCSATFHNQSHQHAVTR